MTYPAGPKISCPIGDGHYIERFLTEADDIVWGFRQIKYAPKAREYWLNANREYFLKYEAYELLDRLQKTHEELLKTEEPHFADLAVNRLMYDINYNLKP